MKKTDLSMQELVMFMNSYANGEFIIHVELTEETCDEQE